MMLIYSGLFSISCYQTNVTLNFVIDWQLCVKLFENLLYLLQSNLKQDFLRITFHFSETKSVVLNLTTWIDYFLFSFQILFIMRTRSQKHLVDHHEADEAVPSDNTPAPLLNMDKEHEEQMINNFRSEKEREQEQKNEKVQEKKVDELDTVGAVTSQVEIVVAYSHFFSPKLFCPLIALFFPCLI